MQGGIWSQHLDPSGNVYYYNSVTKVSTYTAPTLSTSVETLVDGGWCEYKDKNDKSYYFNSVTNECVWDEPEEIRVRKAREEAEKLGLGLNSSNQRRTIPMTVDEEEEEEGNVAPSFDHLSKKEAIAEFKKLLKDCDISSTTKWSDVMRRIADEVRFLCLKTLGEKKQAFAEYQTQRAKEEKQEKRLLDKKRRQEFMKMLAGCETITARSSWHEARELLAQDERFTAVSDEQERRDLFDDFLRDLIQSEREFRKKERDTHYKQLRDVLYSHSIPAVQRLLAEKFTKTLSSVENVLNLDPTTRLSAELQDKLMTLVPRIDRRDVEKWFREFMDDVRQLERAEHQKERDRKLKLVQDDLKAYKDSMATQIEEKFITPNSRWKEYKDSKAKSYFQALEAANELSLVRQEFENTVDQLRREFRTVKDAIEPLVVSFSFSKRSQVADLPKEADELKQNHPLMLEYVFEEIKERELRAQEEMQKKMVDFVDLLTEYYYRSDHIDTTWSRAREEMGKRSAFKRLGQDDLRRKVFESYMKKLRAKMDECTKSQQELERKKKSRDSSSEDERRHSKKHKKKKKRRVSSEIEPGEII